MQVNPRRYVDIWVFCFSCRILLIQKGFTFGVFFLGPRFENKVVVQKVAQFPERVKLVNVFIRGETKVFLVAEDTYDPHSQVVYN